MERKRYRMKAKVGKHRKDGVTYRPGDNIDLFPYEAEKIADKLETTTAVSKVSEPEPVKKVEPAPEPEPPKVDTSSEPVVETSVEETSIEEEAAPVVGLKMVEIGNGLYDVLNEGTGVKLNDQPLSHQDAVSLVAAENAK